jgi:hypothetical protein
MATQAAGEDKKDTGDKTSDKELAEFVGGVFRQRIGQMVREQLKTSSVVLFGRSGDKYTKMAKHVCKSTVLYRKIETGLI